MAALALFAATLWADDRSVASGQTPKARRPSSDRQSIPSGKPQARPSSSDRTIPSGRRPAPEPLPDRSPSERLPSEQLPSGSGPDEAPVLQPDLYTRGCFFHNAWHDGTVWNVKQPELIHLCHTVTNEGATAAGPFKVRIRVDSQNWEDIVSFPGLAGGSKKANCVQAPVLPVGTHDVSYTVDYLDEVKEYGEGPGFGHRTPFYGNHRVCKLKVVDRRTKRRRAKD
jgi:hypothetical protein